MGCLYGKGEEESLICSTEHAYLNEHNLGQNQHSSTVCCPLLLFWCQVNTTAAGHLTSSFPSLKMYYIFNYIIQWVKPCLHKMFLSAICKGFLYEQFISFRITATIMGKCRHIQTLMSPSAPAQAFGKKHNQHFVFKQHLSTLPFECYLPLQCLYLLKSFCTATHRS